MAVEETLGKSEGRGWNDDGGRRSLFKKFPDPDLLPRRRGYITFGGGGGGGLGGCWTSARSVVREERRKGGTRPRPRAYT